MFDQDPVDAARLALTLALVISVPILGPGLLVGLAVSLFQAVTQDPGPDAELRVFTLLTIGDGLASQIPAFIIAVAAGLIVARTSDCQALGDEIPRQLASQPGALYLISGFLALLAFTPLPTVPLLAAALVLGGLAWALRRVERAQEVACEARARADASARPPEPGAVEDLLLVDTLEIEVGYGLVGLVDAARGGDLLERIAMVRRGLATELGIVVPPVRIRDDVELEADSYRVRLRGAVIGAGTVDPRLLPDAGTAAGEIATRLADLVRRHAHELLTREEVGRLLDLLRKKSPRLVEETVPGVVKPGELQKVLQNLLRERVPVRDLEAIVEAVGEWGAHTRDPDVLTEYARLALRRTISGLWSESCPGGRPRLRCVTVDPPLADLINGCIDRGPGGTTMSVPTHVAGRVAQADARTAGRLLDGGHPLVVLTPPAVRAAFQRILAPHLPGVAVLSYNEVAEDLDVESTGLVQWDQPVGTGAA